ncbi:MAG: bifunctional nuclease family protein [bacterium]|nr:bifunctional nuclease family protein [bacterium]
MFETTVQGLFIDRKTGEFLTVLKETDGDRTVPIWIQFNDMLAMAKELSGDDFPVPPRPLTHDLAREILTSLNARVTRVRIVNLDDHVYHAQLELDTDTNHLELDARPSDAIVLALKFEAPIFVTDKVMEQHRHLTIQAGQTPKSLLDRLQQFRPEDFMFFR